MAAWGRSLSRPRLLGILCNRTRVEFCELLAFRRGDEGPADDLHFRTYIDALVEIDDIRRTHANATIGRGRAESPFFWCAVDVNAAAESIAIVAFLAMEPDDARDNGVAAGGVGLKNFAGGASGFEHHALGGVAADFFGNAHLAHGGAIATGSAA